MQNRVFKEKNPVFWWTECIDLFTWFPAVWMELLSPMDGWDIKDEVSELS